MQQSSETNTWYANYYAKHGLNRNDLRSNPGVLLQSLATEASVIRAAYAIEHNPTSAKVLNVGCGIGDDFYHLLKLKYTGEMMVGIDALPQRIAKGKKRHPQIQLMVSDASRMEFERESFDLVYESMMFVQLTDHQLRSKIADEMIRVCKVGGYIMLVDWWMPKPGDANYKALTRNRMQSLFGGGSATRLVKTSRGALVPPLGRFLSRYCPSLYFLVAGVCPFLVGQVTYLLQKTAGAQPLVAGDDERIAVSTYPRAAA